MKAFKNALITLAMIVALAAAVSAQHNPCNPCGGKKMKMTNHDGTMFKVDDPMNRNSVTFKSTAPLEDIVGTSNKITGYLTFDPENPKKGGHGKLTVPVASLNTGIPLRDEHLVGADWLSAAANPNIVFEITDVKNVRAVKKSADAQTFNVDAVGTFSLNGVTNTLTVPARVTYLVESEATKQRVPGNLLAARTTFDIALADYNITGPKGMDLIGAKVGETVEVEVSVVGSDADTGGAMTSNPCGDKKAMNPCNPCGGKKPMNPCNPCGGKR